MTRNGLSLQSILDQRYYHFVLLKSADFSERRFWNSARAVDGLREDIAAVGGTMTRRKVRSEMSFGRGAVGVEISERGNGLQPFLYDVFLCRFDVARTSFVALGFPFLGLARALVGGALASGVIGDRSFVGVDLLGLVRQAEKTPSIENRHVLSKIVGLEFAVADEVSLTSVRLGGDAPLTARIYTDFLRSKVSRGFVQPSQCVLSSQRVFAVGDQAKALPVRARVRLDRFGNVRFYAHSQCANVGILPAVIDQLYQVNCVVGVPKNPLTSVTETEEE